MRTCSVTSVVIFLINLSCTIVFKAKWGADSDINSLYQGECSKTGKISTGLHVIINILSTLLLGALNLCMQLLAAPTRSEIDRAHKEFVWLDIGVPSLRNLRHRSGEIDRLGYSRDIVRSSSLSVSEITRVSSSEHNSDRQRVQI